MATLLNQKLLKSCVEKFNFPDNNKRQRIDEIISAWQTAFKDHDLSKAKETSLQGKFFSKFFCEILGYTMQDDGQEVWTLKQEAKTEVDGKEADGSLGYYSKTSAKTRCVIELKDAQCNLDSKQQSRESKQTPVEQAFQYLYKFADCDWVIVSNFRYTRLYHKSKGQTAYEEFDILNLHEEKEFKRFYYCLCKENLLNENSCSQMDLLIKQSGEADIDITKEFYAEFKTVRKILFEHIVENNPDFDKKLLLEKTQKLLDRFIFIFFCEDTAGLLPHNTVENIYKMAQNSFSLSECKIWEQFRGLFVAIDKGNNNVNPPINAYNGGLFAYDEILDKLIIKDEMFTHIKELARYDFESDLNVNILGHIFEQSLSDLEQIKNELDGIQEDKKNSKRKKDGIHYTPEYITHYIVKNTIERYLEENPEQLKNIKILDSSCGSGAFLNQAHTSLRKEYQIQLDRKISEVGSAKNLNIFSHTNPIENDRTILLNNLFGIDINPESTEITKLALWLKTANKSAPLQNLDKNIKCGNSLFYDWLEDNNDGKFHIIIGNPPYIKEYTNKKAFDGLHASPYYQGKMDLWTLFACQAIDKLTDNGYLSFIAPNSWLTNSGASIFRNKILQDGEIIKFIDFGDFKVFKDAGIQTMIFVFKKCTPRESYEVDYCKVEDKNLGEDIIKGFIENDLQESITGITKFRATIKPSELKDKNITFLNNNIDVVIDKIAKNENITYFEDKEIGQGIVAPQDFLNNTNANILGEPFKKDDGIFCISENEKQLLKFNDCELQDLIKPYYTSNELYKYYGTSKNQFWVIYTSSKFKDEKEILKYPNVKAHLDKFQRIITSSNKPYGLHRARDEKFFKGEKIISYRKCIEPTFSYTDFDCYVSQTFYSIKTDRLNMKYLTGLLNSNLIKFWLKNQGKMQGDMFQVDKEPLLKIPVKVAENEIQEKIGNMVLRLIEQTKLLKNSLETCLEAIKLNYNLQTIPSKLNEFYKMGINPFKDELAGMGVEIGIDKIETLMNWYKEKSSMLLSIEKDIQAFETAINQEIYTLYNISAEEIKIIEGV